jgi:hypothetical protein
MAGSSKRVTGVIVANTVVHAQRNNNSSGVLGVNWNKRRNTTGVTTLRSTHGSCSGSGQLSPQFFHFLP